MKVLPHLLDAQGRNSVHPSLFDRDAYQFYLRQNPALISGLRFDVQYKAKGIRNPLVLRMEVRAGNTPMGERHIFETEVKPAGGLFSKWAQLRLDRAMVDKLGTLIAWKASLLQDGEVIAEQESFLW
jgi:hypothetical protein